MEFMRAISRLLCGLESRPSHPCRKHDHSGGARHQPRPADLPPVPYRNAHRDWRTEHGTKIQHTWRSVALWHAWDLNRTNHLKPEKYQLRPGQKYEVYECRWTDCYLDDRTGPIHYHVGRTKLAAPQPKQSNVNLP
jgi:hypothetical protein